MSKRKADEVETVATVLVTGGRGLVGKGIEAVIKRQNPKNENWVFLGSKDGDLRDKEETRAIFEKYKPTYVIHLAARVGGLFSNMKYKVEFWRENVAINDNVLQFSKEYGVKKVGVSPKVDTYPQGGKSSHTRSPPQTQHERAWLPRALSYNIRVCLRPHVFVRCSAGRLVPLHVHLPRQDTLPH